MFSHISLLCLLVVLAAFFHNAYCFLDTGSSSTVAVYWGQNSGNTAQQRLGFYCDNPNIDVFQIAFVTRISGAGGLPEVDFANQEAGCTVYPGTNLLNCPQIGEDIKQCQQKGKTILLSIGGAITSEIGFASDAAAIEAANKMWEVFGPAQTNQAAYRPFGDAVIDGFDFDFETTVSNMVPFANQLRSLMDGAGGKRYFLTAAPQCVFPDIADQEMLDGAIAFDAIWVQFYNNFCGVNAFAFGTAQQGAFNFDLWDGWAKSQSKNKQVKVFIGLPASTVSAGSGYVAAAQLNEVVQWSKAFSSFGGVTFWDASSMYANQGYLESVKSSLMGWLP